jgi:hypothetical protein
MPHHFEFDPEHKILLVVLEGDVYDGEIRTINSDIQKQVNKFDPAAGISDFSSVSAFHVTGPAVHAAASQPSPYPVPTPRFIVAPRDYMFGMARMYQMVGGRTRPELKVVRSREEVFAILGIQNPKFEKMAAK